MATQISSAESCARCGLKRATSALEEKGIFVRLCDDCYWGKDSQRRKTTLSNAPDSRRKCDVRPIGG